MQSLKRSILIVEDEHALRKALAQKFSLEDFVVCEAANGEEGLAAALAQHPDIILLDLLMPVMDGQTMLEKLRQDTWGAHALVVVLTNMNEADMVEKAARVHAFHYLVKSDWKLEDIVKLVKDKLGILPR